MGVKDLAEKGPVEQKAKAKAKEETNPINESNNLEESKEPKEPKRTIKITSREFEQIVEFIEKYGVDTSNLSDEEIVEKYGKIQKIRQEQIQVLSRGYTIDAFDRILSFVPKGMKGWFVRDHDMSISRAKALGWELFRGNDASKKANLASSTGKSDGLVRLGDLVLVVTSEENYAALMIAKEERNRRRRKMREAYRKKPPQGDGDMAADPNFPILPMDQLGG